MQYEDVYTSLETVKKQVETANTVPQIAEIGETIDLAITLIKQQEAELDHLQGVVNEIGKLAFSSSPNVNKVVLQKSNKKELWEMKQNFYHFLHNLGQFSPEEEVPEETGESNVVSLSEKRAE